MIILVQILVIAFLMALSAFFAGTETGVYRLSRLRVRIKAEQGKSSYKMLFSIIQDGQGLILSLLLGNNLVNYALTGLVTIIIFHRTQNHYAAEIYSTAILTPVIFIFGEIVPKNIFYYKANTLVPRLSWFTWFFFRLSMYSGVVPMLKGIFRILSMLFRLDIDTAKAVDLSQRHQVHQIIHETQEEGLLSESQKNMMGRLIDIPGMTVQTVMIKLNHIQMVSVDSAYMDLLEHLKHSSHTRQLVYENKKANIVGYIPVYEVLGKKESFEDLRGVTVAIEKIDHQTSVLEAINILRNQHVKIALVTEQSGTQQHAIGIVTITDLIEELTGELTSSDS
ncbi:MAG: DUF21 domain-containing protein [Planctomycetes bacterium]|nr:DUF21 domain-containing protein [Planctomycetota bacterium]